MLRRRQYDGRDIEVCKLLLVLLIDILRQEYVDRVRRMEVYDASRVDERRAGELVRRRVEDVRVRRLSADGGRPGRGGGVGPLRRGCADQLRVVWPRLLGLGAPVGGFRRL